MALNRDLRTTFDDVADLYDEVRPGYPEGLIEDLINLSGLPPGGRILEIGCGTGKATLPLARRGYSMLCLELGPKMAAVAARNLRDFPQVQVQTTSFEDWPPERCAFDLVTSAQAFHWLDPETRFQKAAACLRPGGSLALFWNHHRGAAGDLEEALEVVYASRAPELGRLGRPLPLEDLEAMTVRDIDESGRFGPVTWRRYPWSARHPTDFYVKGISTSAPILGLASATRQHLLDGIRDAVDAHGGTAQTRCTAMLYVARVRA